MSDGVALLEDRIIFDPNLCKEGKETMKEKVNIHRTNYQQLSQCVNVLSYG